MFVRKNINQNKTIIAKGDIIINSNITSIANLITEGDLINNRLILGGIIDVFNPQSLLGDGLFNYSRIEFSQDIVDVYNDFTIKNGYNINHQFNISNNTNLIIKNGNTETKINNIGEGIIILIGNFNNSQITSSGAVDLSQSTGTIILNGVTTNIDD